MKLIPSVVAVKKPLAQASSYRPEDTILRCCHVIVATVLFAFTAWQAVASAPPPDWIDDSPPPPGPPRIVRTVPQQGATGVVASLNEISVTFDRDMAGGFSWTGGGEAYPEVTDRPRWVDKRTCVLPVKLEEGRYYRVGINSKSHQNFRSAEDGTPVQPTAIYFCTQGAGAEALQKVRVPKILALSPPNGADDVSPELDRLSVFFDVPMGAGFSWTGGGESYPETTGQPEWSADRMTCTLPVRLEPGHSYRLGLNRPTHINFQSAWGVPLPPVDWGFRTSGGAQAGEAGEDASEQAEVLFSEDFDRFRLYGDRWQPLVTGNPQGHIGVINGAFHLLREGVDLSQGRAAFGATSIEQDLDIPVREGTRVVFDAKPVFGEWAPGERAQNEIAAVTLVVEDAQGQETILRMAATYDQPAGPLHARGYRQQTVAAPQARWVRDASFRIRELASGAVRITQINVGGFGWNHEAYLDNVRIIGGPEEGAAAAPREAAADDEAAPEAFVAGRVTKARDLTAREDADRYVVPELVHRFPFDWYDKEVVIWSEDTSGNRERLQHYRPDDSERARRGRIAGSGISIRDIAYRGSATLEVWVDGEVHAMYKLEGGRPPKRTR